MPSGATRINLEMKNIIGSYLYVKYKKNERNGTIYKTEIDSQT